MNLSNNDNKESNQEPKELERTLRRLKEQFLENLMKADLVEATEVTKISKRQSGSHNTQERLLFQVVDGIDQGRYYLGTTNEIKIGRQSDNHIQLSDPKVSRFHATIRRQGVQLLLIDLKSTNGTKLNGEVVSEPKLLKADDLIMVGETQIKVVIESLKK